MVKIKLGDLVMEIHEEAGEWDEEGIGFLIVATDIIKGKMHGYMIDGDIYEGITHTTDPKAFEEPMPIILEDCIIVEENHTQILGRVKL